MPGYGIPRVLTRPITDNYTNYNPSPGGMQESAFYNPSPFTQPVQQPGAPAAPSSMPYNAPAGGQQQVYTMPRISQPAAPQGGGSMPFTQSPRAMPTISQATRMRLSSGNLSGGTGLSGYSGSPSAASPIYSSTSGSPYWNAMLSYASPALQSQSGGSYQDPNRISYYPNYYPGSYVGDPLFRMPWTSSGQVPSWLQNAPR